MLKAMLMIATSVAVLCACGAGKKPATDTQPVVGMANPAAEFCVSQGGRLESKKDAEGNEYALCHLPDGSVVEEWAYFRAHSK